ncbi:TetR/AcrR family transcriptional regulator [Actinophytocola sp.]|uniref:TetR/AcrR family transcriptional regulator n=1 Tax=Actinophytocola sp. TaxID=1872138 RepID=UPI002ED4FA66
MNEQSVRPGRKRSEESRQAILVATLELTAELGYAGLTIEGIAARSGAGKQTIYRWWPSKADVLLEALAIKADVVVSLPDKGSYAADLRHFVVASFALAARHPVADALRALMAQAQLDPEFRKRFWAAFLQRRRDALRVLIDRAAARGDLPAGASADTVIDAVFGIVWYRLLTDRPPDEQLADELVTLISGRTSP